MASSMQSTRPPAPGRRLSPPRIPALLILGYAGCAEFNLIPQSPDPGQAIAGAAAVRKLLRRA